MIQVRKSTLLYDYDIEQKPITIKAIQGQKHELTELENDGLENLAGFIAYKIKDENLGFPTGTVTDNFYSRINYVSEGVLYKPTDELMNEIRKLNHILMEYNGEEIKTGKTISLIY